MEISNSRIAAFHKAHRAADDDHEVSQTDIAAGVIKAFDDIAEMLYISHYEDAEDETPEFARHPTTRIRLGQLYGKLTLRRRIRIPLDVTSSSDMRSEANDNYTPTFVVEAVPTMIDVLGQDQELEILYWVGIEAPDEEGKYDDFAVDLQAAIDYLKTIDSDARFDGYMEGQGNNPEDVARFYIAESGAVIETRPEIVWPEPDLEGERF